MKISIKPNTPLAPLNRIFPDGVPVVDDFPSVAIGEDRQPAWILDFTDLDQSTLNELAEISQLDNMPLPICMTLILKGVFIIPQDWSNELSN